ncbi:MAG TPA: twin-arginine translocase subunit TatC [Arenimonas sp.]|uniref:twin-arginine translocase subunit TatC n=1 Tax=Arenimonas sp. TaxID=1872635 RepID=UPI002BCE4416|nr:twin-arginine translocase subunit TatC [Arenimonas sp.]HMB57297.1 twin-arginine translocase subunit TatC [Arenimonas sp.]
MSARDENFPEESLIGHLIELRRRLLRGVAFLMLVFVALLPVANKLYSWLAAPMLAKLPVGGHQIAIDPLSPFFTPIKLAFFAALMLSMPFLIYQAWAFVAPGLYKHEKRYALPLLASAVTLFYAGCAFAYYLVLPMVFAFLQRVTPVGVEAMPDITHYLDFVLVLFLAFGASFEVPVAVVVLVLLGLVTPQQLKEARGYVVVGIFIVAAVITPPDAISQLMLALPMMLLYEIGVIAAGFVASRPAHATES